MRASALFAITIVATLLGACAVDAEPIDDVETAEQVSRGDEPADDEAEAEADAAANCSVVTTCNAAGPDGTRCRQQRGCGVGAARLECALESVVVCGTAICPVILIKLDGTRENLCAGNRP